MTSTFTKLVESISRETYQGIAHASETGKWPDGRQLSANQRGYCLQLVLLWQAYHNDNPQHMTLARGGELTLKTKQQLKHDFGVDELIIPLRLDILNE